MGPPSIPIPIASLFFGFDAAVAFPFAGVRAAVCPFAVAGVRGFLGVGVAATESPSAFLFRGVLEVVFGALGAGSGFHETCILNSILPAEGGMLPKLKGREPNDGCWLEEAALEGVLEGVLEAFGGILNYTSLSCSYLPWLWLRSRRLQYLHSFGREEIRGCCVSSRLASKA